MEMELVASDAAYRRDNIEYIYKTLKKAFKSAGGRSRTEERDGRYEFIATLPAEAERFLRPTLEDKIADVVAVNYKYEFFRRTVKASGLKSAEYEILLSALIAADIEDDKRYVISRLAEPYAIDGSFTFLMKPLKKKWTEVVGFIPAYFCSDQLRDFVSYIVGEKKGKRVYVAGGGVFDDRYNKLDRAFLAGGGETKLIKEILLSSSGEVEVDRKISETDEYYLKEFFGDKIFFGKGYFS